MTSDRDDYDVFLDTWEPGEILKYSTIPSNLNDSVAQQRLLDDSTGATELTRTAFTVGTKIIDYQEQHLRRYEFFQTHQPKWAEHFCDHLVNAGIEANRVEEFTRCFAELWIDGMSRRQNSPEMMGIKASIRDHDEAYHSRNANTFVINKVGSNTSPTFTPSEMAAILDANANLLETLIPDYMDYLGDDGPTSINNLYVRRGVCMPSFPNIREELHYLSSYSLAVGPVEIFAQTWTNATKKNGVPAIFSAPLPAVQKRVIAFAPLIKGMDLQQLELVVAPPVEKTSLHHLGEHGGIHEFEFS